LETRLHFGCASISTRCLHLQSGILAVRAVPSEEGRAGIDQRKKLCKQASTCKAKKSKKKQKIKEILIMFYFAPALNWRLNNNHKAS